MLPPPDPVRLSLPVPAPPPARGSVPLVAMLAPVAMSLVMWAMTRSALSLLFAALGPVVALAGVLDARRQRRRRAREDDARMRAALERLSRRVAEAHDAERERRLALCVPEGPRADRWTAERWQRADRGPVAVRVGRGAAPSPVRLDDADPDREPPPGLAAAHERLTVEAAAVPDAPLVADAAEGIGVVGPLPLAAAAARGLALQAAAILPPDAAVEAPGGEHWAVGLPHRAEPGEDGHSIRFHADDRRVLVAWARDEAGLPPGCAAIVRLDAGARVPALTRIEARERAEALAALAARHGIGAGAAGPPERAPLGELLAADDAPGATTAAAPGSLAAAIGRDARGPVIVDLVADGPHALVGGTTGSGKSELLVSWVLSMAHGRGPAEVTFLLVDFKGGAAFAPLAGIPHVVGILSDLDARLTRRAIESLRAELLRRERLLADAGARSIEGLPPGRLARLVVVVDEFAAVVAGRPELHDVFADLAARGRSLGLHLVLCTQRPAGVVRDGVLANVTLRIGLRMTDRGDAIALLGDDAAAHLPAEPRGRAVLSADGAARPFQVALADEADVARLRSAAGSVAARPWLDPLPALLPRSAIGAAGPDAIPFGLADLPAEQRQPVAAHRPAAHGHLLVLGAAGSGRTTALAVLASAPGTTVLPSDPANAWQALDGLLGDGPRSERLRADPPRRLLLSDDLDLLLGRAAPDERHELAELVARVLREGPARGIGVAASAHRVAGALQSLAGLFGSRLVLRMASREEQVLAGGAGADHDPALPPGAGTWRGATVQVAWPGDGALPAPEIPELPIAAPEPGRPLAVVASRPGPIAESLRSAGRRVVVLGEGDADAGGPHDALVGDPDAWQAEWTLLGRARRELAIAVVGCTASELRALARAHGPTPPLGSRPGECWLVDGGVVRRARLGGAG